MNDAQQQTSAVVDRNDSDVDSDDDVPMGLWGLCDRSRRWGRRLCGRGLFCVLWSSCALYSPLVAPLVSSKSPLPSRWAVGQRLSERYPPVFFWLKEAGSAQGRQKFHLRTSGACCHPIKMPALANPLHNFFKWQLTPLHSSDAPCCCCCVRKTVRPHAARAKPPVTSTRQRPPTGLHGAQVPFLRARRCAVRLPLIRGCAALV